MIEFDFEKYEYGAWGLSKKNYIELAKIIDEFEKPTIVEFGTGRSTEFLVDYLNFRNKDGKIHSFEDNAEFVVNIDDPKLTYNLRKIVECTEGEYDKMFELQQYDASVMVERKIANYEKNTYFYDLSETDLPNHIDIVIIDGPRGNGRTLAYLHLKNRVKSGSYVLIDDSSRKGFIEKFQTVFPKNSLLSSCDKNVNKWEAGGIYRLYKIN